MILVLKKDSQGNPINLYFIPELCYMAGLDEEATKDNILMRALEENTKLEPSQIVDNINEFLNLMYDIEKDKIYPNKLSSKEKIEFYGIEISSSKNGFNGFMIEEPKIITENNKIIKLNDKVFSILKK